MRRALHLGIKKALSVVQSHYQVDFEAVSSGYVVPVGVKDEEAMNRADALATTTADVLADASPTSCSQTLSAPATLKPEDHWASSSFCLSVSVRAKWPCNGQQFV
jgi:hypothetical protein